MYQKGMNLNGTYVTRLGKVPKCADFFPSDLLIKA